MQSNLLCNGCKNKDVCTELCPVVEKYVSGVEVWDNSMVFTSAENLDYIKNGSYKDIINDFTLGEEELMFVVNMKRLTERQKECFILYYFKDMTQCQVAKHLKIDQRTVNYHLARAKKKIVKVLENKVDYMNVDKSSKLTDDEKFLLKLYFIEGLTQRDIAGILGVSQPAVHKKLSVATSKYNSELSDSVLV